MRKGFRMQESVSKVARIRQAIEDECTALQRIFIGFAVVASHEMVVNKYEAIDQHRNQLAQHVGEEEATAMMIDIYNCVIGVAAQ
jgi:hypothetical protein